MLHSLSTYLLLIMTCSFFLMSLNTIQLDNFVKVKSPEIAKFSIETGNNCLFIDAKGHTFPIKKSSTIDNFDLENEVEVETDALSTIECVSTYFNYPKALFLNVYETCSCTVLKVEFLDIFSPPPNY